MHALYIARQIELGHELHSVAEGIELRKMLEELSEEVLEERLKAAGWDIEIGALETRSGRRLREEEGQIEKKY